MHPAQAFLNSTPQLLARDCRAAEMAEVRYIVERKGGLSGWLQVRARLLGLPLNIVPADQELSELAGELKMVKKVSLADCFAAALAKWEKAELYRRSPVQDGAARNQNHLIIRASYSSKQIHNTQSPPF
jgi:PIN domain